MKASLRAILAIAAAKLGLHAFATPRAVLSRDYRKRTKCTYCHMCGGYGCDAARSGGCCWRRSADV